MRLDYSKKQFANNPLFKRSLMRRKPSLVRRLALAVLVLAVLMAAAWAIFFSGFFAIRDIRVSGNERVPAWEIADYVREHLAGRSWKIVRNDNILTLSEERLVAALTERFVLASADIVKHPPGRIDIIVKERVSSILLKLLDGTRAVLTLDGMVLRIYRQGEPYEPAPGEKVHVLIDDKDGPDDIKERVIHPTVIEAVINAPEAFRSAFASGGISEIHIEGKSSRTLRLVTDAGWAIYVDAFGPLEPQLTNAEIVLRTKVGEDRPKLDYIDARFGEKVFFKLK